MRDWASLSRESYASAQVLLGAKLYRGSVSRAYFSAYAALTHALAQTKGVVFGHGGNNPSHEQLASLAEHNLDRRRFDRFQARSLARRTVGLRISRTAADYDLRGQVGQAMALNCVRDAGFILKSVGIGR